MNALTLNNEYTTDHLKNLFFIQRPVIKIRANRLLQRNQVTAQTAKYRPTHAEQIMAAYDEYKNIYQTTTRWQTV